MKSLHLCHKCPYLQKPLALFSEARVTRINSWNFKLHLASHLSILYRSAWQLSSFLLFRHSVNTLYTWSCNIHSWHLSAGFIFQYFAGNFPFAPLSHLFKADITPPVQIHAVFHLYIYHLFSCWSPRCHFGCVVTFFYYHPPRYFPTTFFFSIRLPRQVSLYLPWRLEEPSSRATIQPIEAKVIEHQKWVQALQQQEPFWWDVTWLLPWLLAKCQGDSRIIPFRLSPVDFLPVSPEFKNRTRPRGSYNPKRKWTLVTSSRDPAPFLLKT